MTYPPPPGPYNQPQQGQQWNQPPGFRDSGSVPPQQAAYPGGSQYAPQYPQPGPGAPMQQPPGKRTGLIIALSLTAVAVIGGVITLVLVLGDSDGNESGLFASPPEQSAPSQAPGAPSGGLPADPGTSSAGVPGQGTSQDSPTPDSTDVSGDVAAVEDLADSLVDALNNRDNAAANALVCPGQGDFDLDQLPDGVEISRPGAVTVSGNTATVPMRMSYAGQHDDTVFPVMKQNSTWCFGE